MKVTEWIESILAEVQKLEELGGPEISEYVVILEAVRFDIAERLRIAKGRIENEKKEGALWERQKL